MPSVAYLGPSASFSEEAALIYFSPGEKRRCQDPEDTTAASRSFHPCRTLFEVLQKLEKGMVDLGIVPVDNSCEGAVQPTLDLLASKPALSVVGEVLHPIEHHLLVRPPYKEEKITRILSHPQAIGQCQTYLTSHYPEADLGYADSTAQAVLQVAQSPEPWAAIGSAGAAKAYGLHILSRSINDQAENATRFWVVAVKETNRNCLLPESGGTPAGEDAEGDGRLPAEGDFRTSLIAGGYDQPGSLYQILREFALGGINLTRIESRPSRTRTGYYLFFIDLDGHVKNARVQAALKAVMAKGYDVRILGSYPKAAGTP
jgi:prephenate dehydratase